MLPPTWFEWKAEKDAQPKELVVAREIFFSHYPAKWLPLFRMNQFDARL